jgi:hypothetical protein
MPKQEPASISYKNPGAMWGSPLAIKWGAQKKAVVLNDGKGQGNNIAVFPTYVAGICAQLDLWRTSKNYRNKRFADAIAIWSGHNEVESYIKFVLARVPGMTRNTIMNDEFWQSAMGIAFLKAQAWHEAGKKYPAPDKDWIEAQRIVFDGVAVAKPKPTPAPEPEPEKVEAAKPEPDDTKPHAAPATDSKTGISEGAKVGIGAGFLGLLTQAWEVITGAPDTILQAMVGAASKPAFWVFAVVIGAAVYVWWRRGNMKKASA